ncbi:MAG: pullulanase-type alpha-1,6-glucosidase, partial [Austwickia sp.]|nr:pullulanase-type alpha-1,6-glucosidase [Austwickia sp.]
DHAGDRYGYGPKSDRPYRAADGTPFDDADYASSATFPDLDPATSFPYVPTWRTAADATVKVPAWLNDPTMYHHRGNSTWTGESVTYGDFVGLDDLFTERPEVVEGMIEIYAAWARTGIDGFRIDTMKHVNLAFWQRFSPAVLAAARAAGNSEFFMFGEVYDGDPRVTSRYTTTGRVQATLDFGFQGAALAFAQGAPTTRLAAFFATDDWYTDTDSNAYGLPTFLGNHDLGRVGMLLAQAGFIGQELAARHRLAHALMYLTRGQPVVYYGDEQGFAGAGGDKDARQDMFATQVAQFAAETLVGGGTMGTGEHFGTDGPLFEHIAGLARLRAAHPALADGAQVPRFAANSAGCYAFSRVLAADGIEYLVIANNATTAAPAAFATYGPEMTFHPIYGTDRPLTADREARVHLTVPPLSVQVFRAERAIPDPIGPLVVHLISPGRGAVVGGRAEIAASVPGNVFAQVSFAMRPVGTIDWTHLGTDDHPPYRICHDVTGVSAGTMLEYRAVAKDRRGAVAATSGFAIVGPPGMPDTALAPPPSGAQGPVITAPGSFQGALGCGADWDPACLRPWLQDPQGTGRYTWTTTAIPAGRYEVKVAHGLSWAENYGAGGLKDGPNQAFTVPSDGLAVTFDYLLATHELTVHVVPPGPDPELTRARAIWVEPDLIAWPPDAVPAGADPTRLHWQLYGAPQGGLVRDDQALTGPATTAYELACQRTGLPAEVTAAHPELTGYLALRLAPSQAGREAVEALLQGQLAIALYDEWGRLRQVSGVQIAAVLDALYAETATTTSYGVSWAPGSAAPTFRLWAPTARSVTLLTWPAGSPGDAPVETARRTAMTREVDGSWTARGEAGEAGSRYLYEVTVYAPSTGRVEVNRVTDPYSVALTLDSTRSVLVDLTDPRWAPDQWRTTAAPRLARSVDQAIYELHIRDFSIDDAAVPPEHRGSYLAFADEGAGRVHLRGLAAAGLTTIHLLPSFDIATIPEDPANQRRPAGDLVALPPDSAQQQQLVLAVAATDGFNWGYDPLHYLAPEGSYAASAAAADGGERIAQFRTMVGALHADGLRVVLDQVFNHTTAHGQSPLSVLDRIVPGYYHRLDADGVVTNSTCCSNTATEHAMMRKLMVDAVLHWARHYRVDGFRFDLMGHHSVADMAAVRAALDTLTLSADGVDGRAITLYGEGWNFGEVADNARFVQARQGQLGGTDIGTFSDRLRDAVRGGGPFDADPRIQGLGTGLSTDPNGAAVNGDAAAQAAALAHSTDLLQLGLAGNLRTFSFVSQATGTPVTGAQIDYNGQPAGYADQPGEVVNYVDAHDNETLFDALALKLPRATTMAERVRMNTLALACATLAQGVAFWHAGADLLRSKSLDRNSYDSGDWFNPLDFTGQINGFGRGLPAEPDNGARWPYMQPLLADPTLKPSPDDIAAATAQAQDLLRLRASTPLFRLGRADAIAAKVTFPASGTEAAVPGVVVMRLDDTVGEAVDETFRQVVVVFNATPGQVRQRVPGLVGADLQLSPVHADGADDVVCTASWDAAAGVATVPARTVAVFVEPRR